MPITLNEAEQKEVYRKRQRDLKAALDKQVRCSMQRTILLHSQRAILLHSQRAILLRAMLQQTADSISRLSVTVCTSAASPA
jgi:hypothetical protein